MKSLRTTLVATAIPLLLTSLPLIASEVPFNAPATERAKESAPLLQRTARALYDSPSAAAPQASRGQRISNLWLFPTADDETVFARYNLTSDGKTTSGTAGAATEHLTVLTVRGSRIVESRELTSSQAELASNEPAEPHWSAAIGTGYAASTAVTKPKVTSSGKTNADSTSSSHGVTASTHWTAKIGAGTAAASTTSVPETKQTSSSGKQSVVAAAHWTSRIGTGHVFDSTSPAMDASVPNAL
jgi:hypothetical protein